ncbi:transposase [Actinomadura sp. BRA 177]|nr:transposase [Actinomadura sp. BRA 177]
MTLAYLKNGETFAQPGTGFGVGTNTAWRYVNETVTLMSARSPRLSRGAKARKDGLTHLVLDGAITPIDRVAADRPFYTGKHKRNGVNLQVIATRDGTIGWGSGPLPGSVHDLKAARFRGLVRELATAGLLVLADKSHVSRPAHQDALQAQEQAQAAQGRRPLPRQPPRPRRTRQRPTEELEDPDQATPLPAPRRSPGQGYPRPPEPRAPRTLKKVRWSHTAARTSIHSTTLLSQSICQ